MLDKNVLQGYSVQRIYATMQQFPHHGLQCSQQCFSSIFPKLTLRDVRCMSSSHLEVTGLCLLGLQSFTLMQINLMTPRCNDEAILTSSGICAGKPVRAVLTQQHLCDTGTLGATHVPDRATVRANDQSRTPAPISPIAQLRRARQANDIHSST